MELSARAASQAGPPGIPCSALLTPSLDEGMGNPQAGPCSPTKGRWGWRTAPPTFLLPRMGRVWLPHWLPTSLSQGSGPIQNFVLAAVLEPRNGLGGHGLVMNKLMVLMVGLDLKGLFQL